MQPSLMRFRPSRTASRRGSALRQVLPAAIAAAAELLLRLWHASWRRDVGQIDRLDRLLAGPEPVLIVFWHGKYFPLFALLENRHATIIVGDSFRGAVIARLSRRFGHDAKLIAAAPGSHSLLEVEEALRQVHTGAVAVDGPLGPSHVVRPGLVRLASDLRLVVLPVSVASEPKAVQEARWDRRELPLPFARVALSVGEPIRIPALLADGDIGEWSRRIRQGIFAADEDAERRLRADPTEPRAATGS